MLSVLLAEKWPKAKTSHSMRMVERGQRGYSGRSAIICVSVGLRAFLHAHIAKWLRHNFAATDNPVTISSQFIKCSVLCLGAESFHGSNQTMRRVFTLSLGRTAGCFKSSGKEAFFNRPPTLRTPSCSTGSSWNNG